MEKKKEVRKFLVLSLILFLSLIPTIVFCPFSPLDIDRIEDPTIDIKMSNIQYKNATVISDGYLGVYWNNDTSYEPEIAVDSLGRVHAVWSDDTDGLWGNDTEIMYATYTEVIGWSNATVISDGYLGYYWNDGISLEPKIVLDNSENIHVIWRDETDGEWGIGGNREIMYVNFTQGVGWSNITVISDGYLENYWNIGANNNPHMSIDNFENIHVVWESSAPANWGGFTWDFEILYVNYTQGIGWSNVSIISDGYNGSYWNDAISRHPAITVDIANKLHVVWYDYTNGTWGTDIEIMYVSNSGSNWSNITIISDGYNGSYWNDGLSIDPDITFDNLGNIHVVWRDETNGTWGTDAEIMHVNYTQGVGWSNATIVSDGQNGIYSDNFPSWQPSLERDSSGNIHVVWLNYIAGDDWEICYANYTQELGWAEKTIISDGYLGYYWNDDDSFNPQIVIDPFGKIHVIWEDYTDGIWGTDAEIMYTFCVFDSTPPIWDQLPSDQSVKYGQNFFYDVNASDDFGILLYLINNTVDFNIDSINGIIRNDTSLNLGTYWLEIYAFDPFYNYCNATIKITIFKNNGYNYYFIISLTILSVTAVSVSTVSFYFYRNRISKKSIIKRKKRIDKGYHRIDNEQKRLLILSQEENLVENLSNIKKLNIITFDETFLKIVNENQWDFNEKEEFLSEMALFNTKEQEEIIQDFKKKKKFN